MKPGFPILTERLSPRPFTMDDLDAVHVEWLHEEWRQGEVGFVFHPGHGGHGYATEAAEVALRLGFTHLGLHNDIFKGEWGEELVYAMLDDELR